MSKRMLVLGLVAAMAACTESPLEPEIDVPTPQFATTSGPWTKDASAMSNWRGVSVWRRSDARIVIGFGKEMAKVASYDGGGSGGTPFIDSGDMKATTQYLMFRDLERAVGAGLMDELYQQVPTDVIRWFRQVRNGKSVGLWVLVYPPGMYGLSDWTVVAVERRPKGSNAVPWI